MKLEPVAGDPDGIHLTLTREQLRHLAGALNEAMNAVDDWEYPIRLGVSKDEAARLRDEIESVMSALANHNADA